MVATANPKDFIRLLFIRCMLIGFHPPGFQDWTPHYSPHQWARPLRTPTGGAFCSLTHVKHLTTGSSLGAAVYS